MKRSILWLTVAAMPLMSGCAALVQGSLRGDLTGHIGVPGAMVYMETKVSGGDHPTTPIYAIVSDNYGPVSGVTVGLDGNRYNSRTPTNSWGKTIHPLMTYGTEDNIPVYIEYTDMCGHPQTLRYTQHLDRSTHEFKVSINRGGWCY